MKEKGKKKEFIYFIKIILLGESGVGKTSLINVYFDNNFNNNEISTGSVKESFNTEKINNKIYKINIWDTMGQEKYRSLVKTFINESNIVIFVYDITRKKTFTELKYWVDKTKEELTNEKAIFGVAGNKIDLIENLEIDKNEGEKFAKSIGALFCETSAKENPKTFKSFIQELLKKMDISDNSMQNEENFIQNDIVSFKLNKNKKKNNKKKCCL